MTVKMLVQMDPFMGIRAPAPYGPGSVLASSIADGIFGRDRELTVSLSLTGNNPGRQAHQDPAAGWLEAISDASYFSRVMLRVAENVPA